MKYDFHIHTKYSDGEEFKQSLLRQANLEKLDYISFTDHNFFDMNNTKSLDDIYFNLFNEKQNVNLVNGIEFDVSDFRGLHILMYDLKEISLLVKKMEFLKLKNDLICSQIVDKINNYYNYNLSINDIKKFLNVRYLTKRLLIDWFIANGFATSIKEAGDKFTNKKSPTYIKKDSLSFSEIFEIARKCDGLTILAHPSTLNLNEDELEKFIVKMIEYGLNGIEVFNADKTSNSQFLFYSKIAKKYNLLKTCGTDFHNYKNGNIGLENDISKEFIKMLWKRNTNMKI